MEIDLETTAKTLGSAVAIAEVLRRFAVNPMLKFIKKLNLAINELVPNGGGSIKDSIGRMERKLDMVQRRTDIITDSLPDGIYECDAEGRCTFASLALCKAFGLQSSEMMGIGWLSAIHPEDRQPTHEVWMESVKTGTPYRASYRVVNQVSGEEMLCTTEARAVKNGKGEVIGYYGKLWPDTAGEPYRRA